MKKLLAFIGLFFLLLGGCQMNQDVRPKDIDPEDLPDVPAFQDEATREFLVSTEEVEPGLYLMESKLQGFQVLFPEGAFYSEDFSFISDKNVETFAFEDINNDTEVHLSGQVNYHRNQSYLANTDFMLDSIKDKNGYEGELKTRETEDQKIYFGKELKTVEAGDNVSDVYIYIGYIESKKQEFLAIDYNFQIYCFNSEENVCSKGINERKIHIEKIIDSLTFIYQEEADRDE